MNGTDQLVIESFCRTLSFALSKQRYKTEIILNMMFLFKLDLYVNTPLLNRLVGGWFVIKRRYNFVTQMCL